MIGIIHFICENNDREQKVYSFTSVSFYYIFKVLMKREFSVSTLNVVLSRRPLEQDLVMIQLEEGTLIVSRKLSWAESIYLVLGTSLYTEKTIRMCDFLVVQLDRDVIKWWPLDTIYHPLPNPSFEVWYVGDEDSLNVTLLKYDVFMWFVEINFPINKEF